MLQALIPDSFKCLFKVNQFVEEITNVAEDFVDEISGFINNIKRKSR